MQFFRETHIDFLKRKKVAYVVSASLILMGLISMILRGGPNYGIDFRGGISIRLKFQNPVSIGRVRTSLSKIGLGNSEIKEIGSENEILIRVEQRKEGGKTSDMIINHLREDFRDNPFDLRSVDKVGPKIGRELRKAAVWAILVSLLLILIYITWRFEFKFAIGAIVPLFHDVLITLGIFSLWNLEISLAVIAAFLTIVGYSLNDTIVVFDRIRENLRLLRRGESYEKVVNTSINEVLGRTIITSFTTFIVVLILFLFGGDVIHNFAFALLVGVIVGTYSSIYVASPIVVEWSIREERRKLRTKAKR